jgi:hypothetical protein
MTIGVLIFSLAAVALPRVLRTLPGIIDALGRYRLTAALARLPGEKSTPRNAPRQSKWHSNAIHGASLSHGNAGTQMESAENCGNSV